MFLGDCHGKVFQLQGKRKPFSYTMRDISVSSVLRSSVFCQWCYAVVLHQVESFVSGCKCSRLVDTWRLGVTSGIYEQI